MKKNLEHAEKSDQISSLDNQCPVKEVSAGYPFHNAIIESHV